MFFQSWLLSFALLTTSLSLKDSGAGANTNSGSFGKTKFYTMIIDAATVSTFKPDETLYFTIDYNGVAIWKDQVRLQGYRHVKGQTFTTPFELKAQYEKIKLSFNKKYATYRFPSSALQKFFTDFKAKGVEGSILLVPIDQEFSDGYVHYEISFLKDRLPFADKTARIALDVMDPCPPKACSTNDD